MKVTELETYLVSVPYKHVEVSTRVQRGGVTAVIVKISCDNGLVGWGETSVVEWTTMDVNAKPTILTYRFIRSPFFGVPRQNLWVEIGCSAPTGFQFRLHNSRAAQPYVFTLTAHPQPWVRDMR